MNYAVVWQHMPSVPCRALRHVKEPKSDVEVVTFGKILGHFSPIVPPSVAGFASVASDTAGLLWRKLERSKSLVLLQVVGLTCRWQRHSVKTFLLRMLNDSWADRNQTKGCSADCRRRRIINKCICWWTKYLYQDARCNDKDYQCSTSKTLYQLQE
jgi:hypothetical protein